MWVTHLLYHDPMATADTEYEQVYLLITEIAARCDGARSLDYKGFDGQDTHFGRRVASVPFSQWTDDVRWECARLANKYREQGLAYTGIDASTLQVVKDAVASGLSTNHTARNEARAYEKRAKHLAARQIGVVRNAKGEKVLGIRWANGDPDFGVFLKLVQGLPGRVWNPNTKTNEVPYSPQVDAFINEHDFTLTENGQAFVEATRATQAAAPESIPQPTVNYEVWLGSDGRVVVKTNLTAPGQPAADAVRMLPGRSFNRALYANTANATPQVLAFARQFNLQVQPEAVRACEAAGAALEATNTSDLAQADIATVMNAVSRCGKPEDLPAAFVMMLQEILP